MGLTAASTGMKAVDSGLILQKQFESDQVIALAGNPNVGKSTVFNELTGLRQHTGNWPGKTVANAQGYCQHKGSGYVLVDIPGTYSLMAHSAEEEVARDFICFGEPDAVVVVCDATCLERNMNLVLQTIEITKNVVVCVNLIDEAKKKKIKIDFAMLEKNLGVPVVATSARSRKGLGELMDRVAKLTDGQHTQPVQVRYIKPIECAVALLVPVLEQKLGTKMNARWVALRLLEGDEQLRGAMAEYLGKDLWEDEQVLQQLAQAQALLRQEGITHEKLRDNIVACVVLMAESVCGDAVFFDRCGYNAHDRKLDRLFTSRWTGVPVMLLLLAGVFWLTITGANYPSQLLSSGLFWLQDRLTDLFVFLHAPDWLHGVLVLGMYRVLAWVVAVMLPPMAIFFPLFTLLEDSGYLPRVAFNLDRGFQKSGACGKQALTMCMGFPIL